jgi:hypothetical protein
MYTIIRADYFRAAHATAADKDLRFYLCGYYFDFTATGRERMVATDSHALLTFPVTIEGTTDGLYTPRIVARLSRAPLAKTETVRFDFFDDHAKVTELNKWGVEARSTLQPYVDGVYPDYATVAGFADNWQDLSGPVGFNPELIARMVRPLPHPAVKLQQAATASPIRVISPTEDDLYMIVMPCRV